jgi:hypothetical protein
MLVVAVPAIAAQSDGLGNGNNGSGLGNLLGNGLGGLGGFLGLGNGNNGNGLGNGFGLFGNHNNNGNGFDNNHNGNGFNNGFGGSGISQDPTQTFVSGSNQNTGGAVNSTGDNSNTCAAQENFNNSGGVLNQQSLQQYASQSGGVLFGGPSFTNAPNQTEVCNPAVQQSAASSSQ